MKMKERFDAAKLFGIQASKSTHLDNASAVVLEAYAAYLTYLKEHSLTYNRNEFIQLANGWRNALRDAKAAEIPDTSAFFHFAKRVEDEARLSKMQDKSTQEWFLAAQKFEALIEGCNDLPGDDEVEDILEYAEDAIQLIRMKQTVTTRQKSRLKKCEAVIIEKLTKFLEED